jgi:hypothetical protein
MSKARAAAERAAGEAALPAYLPTPHYESEYHRPRAALGMPGRRGPGRAASNFGHIVFHWHGCTRPCEQSGELARGHAAPVGQICSTCGAAGRWAAVCGLAAGRRPDALGVHVVCARSLALHRARARSLLSPVSPRPSNAATASVAALAHAGSPWPLTSRCAPCSTSPLSRPLAAALEHAQALPETASIALFLAAIAPTLRVRAFSLRELELALAYPDLPAAVSAALDAGEPLPLPAPGLESSDTSSGNDLLCLLLSRLLIDEKGYRAKLVGDEGLGWAWVNRFFRETVRAWYRRRALLRTRCDALVVNAAKSPFLHPPRHGLLAGEEGEEGTVKVAAEPSAGEGEGSEEGVPAAAPATVLSGGTASGPSLTGYKRARGAAGEGEGEGEEGMPQVGEVRFLPLSGPALPAPRPEAYTLAAAYRETTWAAESTLAARSARRQKELLAAAGAGRLETLLGYGGRPIGSGKVGKAGRGAPVLAGLKAPTAAPPPAGAAAAPAAPSAAEAAAPAPAAAPAAAPEASIASSPSPMPDSTPGVDSPVVGAEVAQEGGAVEGAAPAAKRGIKRARGAAAAEALRREASRPENVPSASRRASSYPVNYAAMAEGVDASAATRSDGTVKRGRGRPPGSWGPLRLARAAAEAAGGSYRDTPPEGHSFGQGSFGVGRGPLGRDEEEDPGVGEDGMPLLRKPTKFVVPEFDTSVEEADIEVAIAPSTLKEEAGEAEIEELFEWDSLLEVTDAVGAEARGTGEVRAGEDVNPLATAHWSELPLHARLKVLHALLTVRVTWQDDELWEVVSKSASAAQEEAEEAAREAGGEEEGAAAAEEVMARFPFRMRTLGCDRAGARYLSFPSGMYKYDTRVYIERDVRLRSGRAVRTWAAVPGDREHMRALIGDVERGEKEAMREATAGGGRQRGAAAAALAAAAAASASLLADLREIAEGITGREEKACARRERDVKAEAASAGPRRQSGRNRGEGEEEDEGDGGAGTPAPDASGPGEVSGADIAAAVAAGTMGPLAHTRGRRGRPPSNPSASSGPASREKLISMLEYFSPPERVATIIELIDTEPEYLRYVGMPLQAAILGAPGEEALWSEESVSRVWEMKGQQIKEEVERLRRAHKEADRRMREKEQSSKVLLQVAEKEAEKERKELALAEEVRGTYGLHTRHTHTHPTPPPHLAACQAPCAP